MENSLKGILVTLTIVGLFITSILNFIVLFPQEQGVTFDDAKSTHGYLIISQNNDTNTYSNLNTIKNNSEDSFDQWDITQGFMGSNQIAHNQKGVISMMTGTFNTLKVIATELFTANSPIVYAIIILTILGSTYMVYMIIKFVRTGS